MHRLFGFGVDFLAHAQLADCAVGNRIADTPVNVAVPDIAGMFFRRAQGAIEIREHGLAQILFQVQIEGIQQIVFGREVAKQSAFGNARVSGDQRGRRRNA
ncbi:hypothetical protein D3C78_1044900 [compost metagenome]